MCPIRSLFIIVLFLQFQSLHSIKILVYNPIFAQSHVNFMSKIAEILNEEGHDVVSFICFATTSKPSRLRCCSNSKSTKVAKSLLSDNPRPHSKPRRDNRRATNRNDNKAAAARACAGIFGGGHGHRNRVDHGLLRSRYHRRRLSMKVAEFAGRQNHGRSL